MLNDALILKIFLFSNQKKISVLSDEVLSAVVDNGIESLKN